MKTVFKLCYAGLLLLMISVRHRAVLYFCTKVVTVRTFPTFRQI